MAESFEVYNNARSVYHKVLAKAEPVYEKGLAEAEKNKGK